MSNGSHMKWSACLIGAVVVAFAVLSGQRGDAVADLLTVNQKDLGGDGRAFLLQEAARARFLAIGGLHGDNETPALVQDLALALGPTGYRHVAVEMSPWAARRVSMSLGDPSGERIWGLDIEEVQPHMMIRELAAANPTSTPLQTASDMTRSGYRRDQAPALLALIREAKVAQDVPTQRTSIQHLTIRTLAIETARLDRSAALSTSMDREEFMKEQLVANYRRAARDEATPKAVLAFGQNHLHRGYDRRGVSTLGNFVAELAAAEGGRSFHVALFAAGGRFALGGLHDADQRGDEPAFALLASAARFPATVFDVRPLRQALRGLDAPARTPQMDNLLYWADSYDAIICYRTVTPSADPLATR